MTDADVIAWVLACHEEAHEARIERESLAQASWRSYMNDHDFSKKAAWQSKVPLPVWAMSVDQAKGAMGNALKKAQRLFTIEVPNPYDPMLVKVAHFTHDALSELLRQANINQVLTDGIHSALISNVMAFKAKITTDEIERYEPQFRDKATGQMGPDGAPAMERVLDNVPVLETKTRLDIPVINSKHLWLDPTNKGLYKIHRALWDIAKLESEDSKNLFRASARNKALSADAEFRTEDEQERREMRLWGTRNPFRRQVELLEYWGPIYDKQGRLVHKNRWVILFNRKELALMDKYPFWHGGDPFAVTNLLRVPFSPYGKMLYQHVGPLNYAITEFLCMMLDAQKFGTLKGIGVDTGLMEDMEELADGLYPGIVLSTTGPQAIQELNFKGVDSMSMQVFGELMQNHQNYSAVNEFISGAPSTRGRATATEVSTKTQQSGGFFDAISGDVEEFGFVPLIEKCWWNMLQYFDGWDQPYMAALIQKHGLPAGILGSNAVERYKLLKQPFRFHVTGLSNALRRAEQTEKLLRLLEVLGNMPIFQQNTDMMGLYDRVLEAFDFEDLVQQGNAIPGVIAPGATAPPGGQPVSGMQGMVGVPSPGAGPPPGKSPGKRTQAPTGPGR